MLTLTSRLLPMITFTVDAYFYLIYEEEHELCEDKILQNAIVPH